MKTIKIIFALIIAMSCVACSKVPAGYKGVKVYLFGSEKGVEAEELGTGRYWIGWNEELYLFPTFTQNYIWTKDKNEGSPNDESISFQTIEGLSVNADVGISYAVKPDRVDEIFQKYRKKIDEITDIYLRNMVRDAFVSVASTKTVETIYGKGKAQLLSDVETRVKEQCGTNFNIERIYLVGDLRLPPTVVASLNAKIQATQQAQRVENEIRQAQAEAKKKVASAEGESQSILIKAKAQADANIIIAKSLTSELVQYEAIKIWDGKLPLTMVPGSSTPIVNIK